MLQSWSSGPGPLALVLWSWSFETDPLALVLWSWSFGPGPLVLGLLLTCIPNLGLNKKLVVSEVYKLDRALLKKTAMTA